MARLFVAVQTDARLRAALSHVAAAARLRRASLVPEAQLHLTVRFLGDVEERAVGAVGAAVARTAAPHRPFSLEVTGGGGFGPRHAPSVLWAGIGGAAPLVALADDVDAALAELGCAPRDRPLSPHITLARGKGHRAADVDALAGVGHVGTLRVSELVLFESVPSGAGMVHTARAHAPLCGAGPTARSGLT